MEIPQIKTVKSDEIVSILVMVAKKISDKKVGREIKKKNWMVKKKLNPRPVYCTPFSEHAIEIAFEKDFETKLNGFWVYILRILKNPKIPKSAL